MERPLGPKKTPLAAQGLGSNSKPQSQYTLEKLKKMAASRGLTVEQLVAQMVQQYLLEEKEGK